MSLAPCPGCRRHVLSSESACPFCQAPLKISLRGRAAVVGVMAVSALAPAACKPEPSAPDVTPSRSSATVDPRAQAPAYGMPPPAVSSAPPAASSAATNPPPPATTTASPRPTTAPTTTATTAPTPIPTNTHRAVPAYGLPPRRPDSTIPLK